MERKRVSYLTCTNVLQLLHLALSALIPLHISHKVRQGNSRKRIIPETQNFCICRQTNAGFVLTFERTNSLHSTTKPSAVRNQLHERCGHNFVVRHFRVGYSFYSSRRHCSAHTVLVATQMDKIAVVYHGNGGGQSKGRAIWRWTALQWTFAFITLVSRINRKLEFSV